MYSSGKFDREKSDEVPLAQTSDYLSGSWVAGDSDLFPGSGVARRPGGGNWITLDFRGLIFWTYITLVAVHVTLSSIAVLLFPKAGALRIHLGSMVLSVILLVTGVAVYGKCAVWPSPTNTER